MDEESRDRRRIDLGKLAFAKMGDIAHGLRFVFAVAEGSGLRRELDAMGRKLSGHRDVGLGWLGDWVMVGSADRSGLWDVASGGANRPPGFVAALARCAGIALRAAPARTGRFAAMR